PPLPPARSSHPPPSAPAYAHVAVSTARFFGPLGCRPQPTLPAHPPVVPSCIAKGRHRRPQILETPLSLRNARKVYPHERGKRYTAPRRAHRLGAQTRRALP